MAEYALHCKKINMKKFAIFSVWFLFIFGPVIRSPLGSFGDLSLLSIIFYLTWSVLKGRAFSRTSIPFFFIAFFLSTLAIFNSILVSSTIDSHMLQTILRPIKGFLIFLGLFFAVKYLSIPNINRFGRRKTYEVLLYVVYAAIVIHGMIIVLQFLYPPFRDFTYMILKDLHVLAYNKQFRMPGLAGAGGAQVSAVQGLGFLVGVHLAIVNKKYFFFLLGNLLLIASIVLTGRTGFVLVGISGFYWFLTVFVRLNKKWRVPRVLLKGRVVFGIIVFVVVMILSVPFLSSSYEKNGIYRMAINRTFETYYSYKETGHLSDRTLVALSKMFVFPEEVGAFIIGNSRLYNNTTGVYASDLGYIRLLWGYGLVGLIGHVIFFLFMVFFVLRPCVLRVMGFQNVVFGLFFLVSFFILNFKEVFFFTRMIYPITIIVVMGLYWLCTDPSPPQKKNPV